MRGIVAQNVRALLDRDFPGKRGQHNRFVKQHQRISLSKIQRASSDGGVNLETIEELATAFRVAPYQLLLPGLNAKEPQIAIEKRYYETARDLARRLTEVPQ